MKRRTVLAAGGVVVAGGVLAACGMGDGEAGEGAEQEAGEVEGGEAGAAAPAAPPAGAVALVADVPVGGGYVNPDVAVVVTQPDAGTFNAFTAVCPHQGCLVSKVVENEIICPCHNSRFSAVDGAVISGPALEGLAAAKVAVQGDTITFA